MLFIVVGSTAPRDVRGRRRLSSPGGCGRHSCSSSGRTRSGVNSRHWSCNGGGVIIGGRDGGSLEDDRRQLHGIVGRAGVLRHVHYRVLGRSGAATTIDTAAVVWRGSLALRSVCTGSNSCNVCHACTHHQIIFLASRPGRICICWNWFLYLLRDLSSVRVTAIIKSSCMQHHQCARHPAIVRVPH
jgi:hypothetical protein